MCRSRRELSLSMSLFLNLLFETDSYSNAYLLSKFGFDTAAAAENEPCQVCKTATSRRGSHPPARAGCGKLYRARSRLYRSQILQVNMRLKALAEIYTMHSFAQLQNHIFFKKSVEFAKICENFQKFCEIRNFSNRFFAKILRLQRCKRMQIL